MKFNIHILIGVIIGFVITFLLIEIKNNCYISNGTSQLKKEIIQKLVRQAARWSTAAEQDESVMVAVLHATYGTGYLWALKDIASDKEIKSATGVDPYEFEKEITRVLDEQTKKMIKVCPDYGPPKTLLSYIGGENV